MTDPNGELLAFVHEILEEDAEIPSSVKNSALMAGLKMVYHKSTEAAEKAATAQGSANANANAIEVLKVRVGLGIGLTALASILAIAAAVAL